MQAGDPRQAHAGCAVTPRQHGVASVAAVGAFRCAGAEVGPVLVVLREERALEFDPADRRSAETLVACPAIQTKKRHGDARGAVRDAGQRAVAGQRHAPAETSLLRLGFMQQPLAAGEHQAVDRWRRTRVRECDQAADAACRAGNEVQQFILGDELRKPFGIGERFIQQAGGVP